MDPSVQNFLYRNPRYYEVIYPEPNDETPAMCRRMFERFLLLPPSSILDIGCGTGRDLASLAKTCPDCWGTDYLPEMIQFAQQQRPFLNLRAGDMQTIRLDRTFDVIMCMGSALMYALSNDALDATFRTFSTHARKNTLLIIDINNAASYLVPGQFPRETTTQIQTLDFRGHYVSRYEFDLPRQLLIRKRTWHITGQPAIEDFCQYRLLFPAELEHFLNKAGFIVRGMFDNHELSKTDLSGLRLYVAASYGELTG